MDFAPDYSTGMNRQMIGRLEKCEYMPSILQLEKLAEVLGFSVPDLFVENEPTVYTAYRSSSMSKEEKAGVDHMFDMMMVSKQQLLLRKENTLKSGKYKVLQSYTELCKM